MDVYDRARYGVIDLTDIHAAIWRLFAKYDVEVGLRMYRYEHLVKGVAKSVIDRSSPPYSSILREVAERRSLYEELLPACESLDELIRDWFFGEDLPQKVIDVRLSLERTGLIIEFESVYDDETILFEDYIASLHRSGEPVHPEITKAIRQFRSIHRPKIPKLLLGHS